VIDGRWLFKRGIKAFLDLPWNSWVLLLAARCVVWCRHNECCKLCTAHHGRSVQASPLTWGSKAISHLLHCFQSLVVFGNGAVLHVQPNVWWMVCAGHCCRVQQLIHKRRILDWMGGSVNQQLFTLQGCLGVDGLSSDQNSGWLDDIGGLYYPIIQGHRRHLPPPCHRPSSLKLSDQYTLGNYICTSALWLLITYAQIYDYCMSCTLTNCIQHTCGISIWRPF